MDGFSSGSASDGWRDQPRVTTAGLGHAMEGGRGWRRGHGCDHSERVNVDRDGQSCILERKKRSGSGEDICQRGKKVSNLHLQTHIRS